MAVFNRLFPAFLGSALFVCSSPASNTKTGERNNPLPCFCSHLRSVSLESLALHTLVVFIITLVITLGGAEE